MQVQLEKKKKSKWGGKRDGSGRGKTEFTLMTQKEKREMFLDLLNQSGAWEDICRGLFNKAKRDPKVAAYVIDQVIGKATQVVDANVDGELKIILNSINYKPNGDNVAPQLSAPSVSVVIPPSDG